MADTEVKAHIGFEVNDAPLKKLHEGIASLKEGLFGLTATLVESGIALYETVLKTSEAGEQAIKLGQQTGVGAEQIQKLGYAAKMVGLDIGEVTTGLKFLNRNMFASVTGASGMNDIFAKTGINIRKANGSLRPANEVLGDVADKFKAMPDGAEKAGLAMKVFGRNGITLIPLLNKGKEGIKAFGDEAESLGAILSEHDAEAGKEFQESLKVLMAAFTGIRNIVASELMPAFKEMVDSIVHWVKANRKLIQSGLGGFLKATASYLTAVFKAFMAVGNSIAGFVDAMGGAENATKALLFTIGILAGASLLFGIGKMVMGIYEMATAFSIADAWALLIPIGIGLAIIAVGLLIEDLYQFFSGGDSLIGRFFGQFPKIAEQLHDLFYPIMEPILAIVYQIANGIGSWQDLFKNIGILLLNVVLAPFRLLYQSLGSIFSLASKIPGLGALSGLADFSNAASKNLKLDAVVPGSTPSANNTANSNVNVSAPITVTVPPNTPPGLVGDRVSEGVSNGVGNHLRQAQLATQTGVSY